MAKPLPLADSSCSNNQEVSFEPRQLAPTPMTPTSSTFSATQGEIKIN